MRFQIKHPDSSEWEEIDETQVRRLLKGSYLNTDLIISMVRDRKFPCAYTPTGSQIRINNPDTAPIARDEPEMQEDGWINA